MTPTQQSTADPALEAKQCIRITMALSCSQGLLLGAKDFTEVQNHANAAGQFVGWSALVRGHLYCI